MIDGLVTPLAQELAGDLAKGHLGPPDDPLAAGHVPIREESPALEPHPGAEAKEVEPFPDPDDARIDIDRIRVAAVELRIPGYSPRLSETELRQLVGGWHSERQFQLLQQLLEPLARAGFPLAEGLGGDLTLGNALSAALMPVFLPEPYQPFRSPHPHVALCVSLEQVWEPKGYTRGELINTISLAPGEQLTLELHSWDKSTFKSEEELATELELKASETLTQRDALTVARQVATQTAGHLNANATVPIKGIPVALDGGVSGQLNTNLEETLERTRERTVEASQVLKTSRKLRIEVARDVGRERKQAHVVSNTNRCHSVNCHYFEVMSNYLVTTRVVAVRPCLLLPNARPEITPAWVLCHEAALREALLDQAFQDGFPGARVLETHDAFLELKRAEPRVWRCAWQPRRAFLHCASCSTPSRSMPTAPRSTRSRSSPTKRRARNRASRCGASSPR